MSEAEQSRDTARDPRRDAAAGAATDGDRGAVPAAREPERDTKDAQVSRGAQAPEGGREPEPGVEDAKPARSAEDLADPVRGEGAESAGDAVPDVKDPQDAPSECLGFRRQSSALRVGEPSCSRSTRFSSRR